MEMIALITCDRCGREDVVESPTKYRDVILDTSRGTLRATLPLVCTSCLESFNQWWRNGCS